MRRTIPLCALALVLAACSGDTNGYSVNATAPASIAVTSPPQVVPPVLRATVRWDGSTCTYTGPRTIVEEQQRLQIRFRDRSSHDSKALMVIAGLKRSGTYEELVAWSKTHAVSFYASFPPFFVPGSSRFPGRNQMRDGLWSMKPFEADGRYYLACLGPPGPQGGNMYLATELAVTAADA